ncbi:MAG: hypothetical protein JO214_15175 [Frankiaceae bacterium]|nr:hypothetical protein [Frankiaceae bacterium]
MSRPGPHLAFGVYPLGVAGTPEGLATGPPDAYEKVRAALNDLSGRVAPRTYLVDMEPGGEEAVLELADRYRDLGLLGHVVLGCMRDEGFDLDRWSDLVRTIVARHGRRLSSLQITNEPNLSFMDGAKPYVYDALVAGVIAAKNEARRRGLPLEVGFGSVPQSPVALPEFWPELRDRGGPELADAVDFVGHNFYVDVFEEPVEPNLLPRRVAGLLHDVRSRDLPSAGIPSTVSLRVTENGWPTGVNPMTGAVRSDAQQATVIETIVRTVHGLARSHNITHYMLFGLRDADSAKSDLFHQFGIMRDDYTPKPAYARFKALVAELGS